MSTRFEKQRTLDSEEIVHQEESRPAVVCERLTIYVKPVSHNIGCPVAKDVVEMSELKKNNCETRPDSPKVLNPLDHRHEQVHINEESVTIEVSEVVGERLSEFSRPLPLNAAALEHTPEVIPVVAGRRFGGFFQRLCCCCCCPIK